MKGKYIAILVILSIVVFGLLFTLKSKSIQKIVNEPPSSKKELLVATDPNFPEYLGVLVPGFPEDFPVYPGAVLVGSAKINPDNVPDRGYRAKWELKYTNDSTVDVITWYKEQLVPMGWEFKDPTDLEGIGELDARIQKPGEYTGYIAAEFEGEDEIEIVVNLTIAENL